jgi:hypothetical protein
MYRLSLYDYVDKTKAVMHSHPERLTIEGPLCHPNNRLTKVQLCQQPAGEVCLVTLPSAISVFVG